MRRCGCVRGSGSALPIIPVPVKLNEVVNIVWRYLVGALMAHLTVGILQNAPAAPSQSVQSDSTLRISSQIVAIDLTPDSLKARVGPTSRVSATKRMAKVGSLRVHVTPSGGSASVKGDLSATRDRLLVFFVPDLKKTLWNRGARITLRWTGPGVDSTAAYYTSNPFAFSSDADPRSPPLDREPSTSPVEVILFLVFAFGVVGGVVILIWHWKWKTERTDRVALRASRTEGASEVDPGEFTSSEPVMSPPTNSIPDQPPTGDLWHDLHILHEHATLNGPEAGAETLPSFIDPVLLPYQRRFARDLLELVGVTYVPRRLRAYLYAVTPPTAVREFFQDLNLSFDSLRHSGNGVERALQSVFEILKETDEASRGTPLPDKPIYNSLGDRSRSRYQQAREKQRYAVALWETALSLDDSLSQQHQLKHDACTAARSWPNCSLDTLKKHLQRCESENAVRSRHNQLFRRLTTLLRKTEERLPRVEFREREGAPQYSVLRNNQPNLLRLHKRVVDIRKTINSIRRRALWVHLSARSGSMAVSSANAVLAETILQAGALVEETGKLARRVLPSPLPEEAIEILSLRIPDHLRLNAARRALRAAVADLDKASAEFREARDAYQNVRQWLQAHDDRSNIVSSGPRLLPASIYEIANNIPKSTENIITSHSRSPYPCFRPVLTSRTLLSRTDSQVDLPSTAFFIRYE